MANRSIQGNYIIAMCVIVFCELATQVLYHDNRHYHTYSIITVSVI